MSGAVAAHAAHNGSGTQGLAVTNKVTGDDGDVASVFWNKNDTTRQLLHGSSIVEVQSSGASTLNFGGSRLFTINNDIDCLGDLYLQIAATLPLYGGDGANSAVTGIVGATFQCAKTATTVDTLSQADSRVVAAPAPFAMYDLIERVEFQVGTQVWQTLEKEDIRVVNSTELDSSAFEESAKLTSIDTGLGNTLGDKIASTALPASVTGKAWIVIPGFSKTVAPMLTKFSQHAEDGYPMAAAPHQSVKVKVVFIENIFPDNLTTAAITAGFKPHERETIDKATTAKIEADLAENRSLLNSRFKIQENVPYVIQSNNILHHDNSATTYATAATTADVPSFTLVKSSGSAAITSCRLFAKQIVMCNEEREAMKAMPLGMPKRLKITQNARVTDVGSTKTKTIDLDHFSLYASHIIITGDVGAQVGLASAELKLNSSSFSGVLPAALLDAVAADSMGLYANKLIVANASGAAEQQSAASDTSPSTAHEAAREHISIEEFTGRGGFGTFVFPLASRAYGGSSVPLNRFDSIRLLQYC